MYAGCCRIMPFQVQFLLPLGSWWSFRHSISPTIHSVVRYLVPWGTSRTWIICKFQKLYTGFDSLTILLKCCVIYHMLKSLLSEFLQLLTLFFEQVRRLNNNSLTGPCPESLSKIEGLTLMYVLVLCSQFFTLLSAYLSNPQNKFIVSFF